MNLNDIDRKFVAVLLGMGALIGLGQLLNSTEPLTLRYVFGRAICSAFLAGTAPVVLLWFPAMPAIAEFALAALIASLGTSALVAIVRKLTGAPVE